MCNVLWRKSRTFTAIDMGLRFNSYEYGLIIDDTLLWANIWFHQCWNFFDFDQYRRGYKLTNRLANIMYDVDQYEQRFDFNRYCYNISNRTNNLYNHLRQLYYFNTMC